MTVVDGALRVDSRRVLLVEQDCSVRRAVESELLREGFAVRAETDGCGIEEMVESFQPDVAILGVRRLHGPNGLDMLRQLREVDDLPVLLLTAFDIAEDRLTGFRLGADDAVSKPFLMPELVARVQALIRRSGRTPRRPYRVIDDVVADDATRTVTRRGHEIDLTPVQYDVLTVLSRHEGQIVSKNQLLNQVWGRRDYDDDHVVEVQVCALRRKLDAHGPRFIHTVRSAGYILRPETL